MKTIRLQAEYDSFPTWDVSQDGLMNISPDTLPLSRSLIDQLLTWAQEFDHTLVREDPAKSGFRSPDEEKAFRKRGEQLAQELKAELGREYIVELRL